MLHLQYSMLHLHLQYFMLHLKQPKPLTTSIGQSITAEKFITGEALMCTSG